MAKKTFYSLRVSSIVKSTTDCSIIGFEIPEELQDLFSFQQGQYLTLKKDIQGEEVRRSYSLCSSPLDKEWKVGIKKVPEGKFSTYANEDLAIGDLIEVMPPDGKFTIPIETNQAKTYAAFAAGSGITPILSIIKTHLSKEPNSTFHLFYTNQTVQSIILKEELEALKNQYMSRFEIFYFLTQEQRNIPLFNGRINEEKLNIIHKSIVEFSSIDDFFLCGPEAMILLVRDYLLELSIDKKNIHFELFNTSGKQEERKEIQKAHEGKVSEVQIIEGGKTFNFSIPVASESILDAALRNGADLPFACKGGVCCTCRAKVIEGEVKQLVNYGLEEEELKEGYILTCQALPISDKVLVDFEA